MVTRNVDKHLLIGLSASESVAEAAAVEGPLLILLLGS